MRKIEGWESSSGKIFKTKAQAVKQDILDAALDYAERRPTSLDEDVLLDALVSAPFMFAQMLMHLVPGEVPDKEYRG